MCVFSENKEKSVIFFCSDWRNFTFEINCWTVITKMIKKVSRYICCIQISYMSFFVDIELKPFFGIWCSLSYFFNTKGKLRELGLQQSLGKSNLSNYLLHKMVSPYLEVLIELKMKIIPASSAAFADAHSPSGWANFCKAVGEIPIGIEISWSKI